MSNNVSNKHLKNLQRQKKEQKNIVWKNNRKDRKIYGQKQKELSKEVKKQADRWLINYPAEYNDCCTYYLSHCETLQEHKPNISLCCEFEHSSTKTSPLVSTFICLDVDVHDYPHNNFGCDGDQATMCQDCYNLYSNYVGKLEVRPDRWNNRIVCLINKDKKFVMLI
jgi:hypothetical protein